MVLETASPRTHKPKIVNESLAIKKPFHSGKAFFDISVNTGQNCMGFEADASEK